jgi:hypothetical protein
MEDTSNLTLGEIAAKQYGLATRDQALRCLTRRELQRRVRTGQLILVRRLVYLCEGVPVSWRQRVMAVCLSVGQPVAVSYRSAARLWLLEDVAPYAPEITVPRNRSARFDDVITHRAALPPTDITRRFGIPVTTAIRTIIDLSSILEAVALEKALDDSLRRGDLTIRELDPRLSTFQRGGGRRLIVLRRLVDARGHEYKPGDTTWEDRIYAWIVEAGLPAPVRQHWVMLDGKLRQIDMAYPDLKIAIEFDGWDTHQARRRFNNDRARTIDLQLAGWLVLPFTSQTTRETVIAKVTEARAQRLAAL